MKILYLANIRIPTTRAHGLQIVKTCEAMKKNGSDITLVVPLINKAKDDDVFSQYGVETRFNIEFIRVPNTRSWGHYGFLLQSFVFYTACFLRYMKTSAVIYSRDAWLLLLLSYLGRNTVFEAHSGRGDFVIRRLIKRPRFYLVAITNAIKDYFVNSGLSANSVLVSPDGVDFKKFSIDIDPVDARNEIGLPVDKKVCMYVGSVGNYNWKGLDLFLDSSVVLNDVVFASVGGTEDEIKIIKDKYKNSNLIMFPNQKNIFIPKFLQSADILVLPNRGNNEVSLKYTSPMKLFEYMASGKIIVASNLPSIREILSPSTAVFFEPEHGGSLDSVLRDVVDNISAYKEKGINARIEANKYDWDVRARNIIDFIAIKFKV